MTLTGKIAVVTGAARGRGRAIALRLAGEGAAVSAWDLNGEGVRETADLIAAAGITVNKVPPASSTPRACSNRRSMSTGSPSAPR